VLVNKYHCCVAAMIVDLFGKAIEAARRNGAPHKPMCIARRATVCRVLIQEHVIIRNGDATYDAGTRRSMLSALDCALRIATPGLPVTRKLHL
jgi:hypothetical protein